MTTPFDPYQTRLASLATQLQKDQELSDQIEAQLRVALTPTERGKLQLDYDRLRGDYDRHLAEWENLRQRMGNTSSQQAQAVETQIQRQSAKLTDIGQQLSVPSAPATPPNVAASAQTVPSAPAPQTAATSAPPRIFVSYAHKDKRWFDALQTHLAPLVFGGMIDPWDDTKIPTGSLWNEEIKKALADADIAVLLVTPNFLASRYIAQNELPVLLKDKKLIWIAVSDCSYQLTDLAQRQSANDPAHPLDSLPTAARNREWVSICKKVKEAAAHPK